VVTEREAFEAKKLASRYGVVGKVAANYRTAGYEVKVETTKEEAPYNFIAWKKGEKLLVKVYSKSGEVPSKILENLSTAGEGKKILVLYGAGPRIVRELIDKAKQFGISIKRVRA
jgi:hypothetical protein